MDTNKLTQYVHLNQVAAINSASFVLGIARDRTKTIAQFCPIWHQCN